MKKTCCYFVYCVVVVCLTSCVGAGDWVYQLPNGYEVWHVNSSEILIKYVKDENNADGIPSFVKEFSYDDRYVFSRNISDVENNNIAEEVYYLLDTQEKTTYGPFDTLNELLQVINEQNIEFPKKWFRTSPDPNIQSKQ